MQLIENIKFLESNSLKEEELELTSLQTDYLENLFFKDALSNYNKKNINKEQDEDPFINILSEDLFNSLYKIGPTVFHEDDVVESIKIENKVVKELVSSKNFNDLRMYTANDEFLSLTTMNTYKKRALQIIEEWKEDEDNKEILDDVNKAIKKQEELRNLKNSLDGDEELKKDSKNIEQLEKLKKEVINLNNALRDKISDIKKKQKGEGYTNGNEDGLGLEQLSGMLQGALGQSYEESKEAIDALKSFNMIDSKKAGNLNDVRITYGDKEKFVQELSKNGRLKKVSDSLGKIKQKLNKISKKPSKRGITVCDIGIGNNIKKVLNTEKIKLIDEDLENDFYKKYLENGLLEYKVNGERKNKGPVIMCIDNSSSMAGNSDVWAKSIACALLQIAVKEKREYKAIFFNHGIRKIIDFDYKNLNLDKIFDLININPNGGTSYNEVLREALNSIENSKFKKADILFITDGEPMVYLDNTLKHDIAKCKKEKELMIQSILIDCSNDKYVREFSDSIITLDDLNKDKDVLNALDNIQKH